MVDIGHSELFIRFDAPDGTQFEGEGVVIPGPEYVRAAAGKINIHQGSVKGGEYTTIYIPMIDTTDNSEHS